MRGRQGRIEGAGAVAAQVLHGNGHYHANATFILHDLHAYIHTNHTTATVCQ